MHQRRPLKNLFLCSILSSKLQYEKKVDSIAFLNEKVLLSFIIILAVLFEFGARVPKDPEVENSKRPGNILR